MNDNTKTLAFVGIAAAVLLVAWFARPSLPVAERKAMEGKPLYESFTDPLTAASIEIVQYDESTGTTRPFKVAQVKGRWSIPSHENYPTDAKDQLAAAASSLMDLTVVRVQSEDAGDKAEYGVVEPGPNAGTVGVGTHVIMRDKDDKPLLDVILGKEVPERPGLRFVRRAGEDPIYIVKVSTDKLSAKFEDWIEKDLLKMTSFDLQGFQLHDYTVLNLGGQLGLDPRSRIAIAYSESDPKWKLHKFELFEKGKNGYVEAKLAADEELNTAKLDTMKTALDELKIVDVARKPAGLSANLKAVGQMEAKRESVQSLAQRGFYLARGSDGSSELFSSKGDVRLLMKDGVEYVLRFGEIAGAGSEQKKEKDKDKDAKDAKKGDKKSEESSGPGVNRYLFVMADFNQDAIPKPQMEALPKDEPADAKKPDDKKAEEKKADAKKDGKPADPKKDAKDDKKAERERIEKENKRKQDEYDAKIKKGQEHVKELNARFADWYYVINDDVYKKLHLTRSDVFKKKDKKEEGKKDQAADAHEGHDHAAPGMPPAAAVAPDVKKDAPAVPAAPKKEPPAPEAKKGVPPAPAKEPAKAPADSKK